MPINTRGAQSSRSLALEEIEAPLSSALEVSFAEAWLYSPTSSTARAFGLAQARGDLARDPRSPDLTAPIGRRSIADLEVSGELSSVIDKAEAQRRTKAAGVEDLKVPEEGIREAALQILIDRKKAEKARRSILARAPEGVTPALLKFGAGLVASMFDPINVASAFVPVVSAARYGPMLERARGGLGRAGVRVRVGAVEGTAGAAFVEPVVFGATQAEQADYGMTDSLLNLAFGTALGGGLHTGAGAVGDALRRGRPWWDTTPQGGTAERVSSFSHEQRVAATRVAVAQAASGKRINVGPVIKFFDETNRVRPPTLEAARRTVVEAESERMRAQVEIDSAKRVTPEDLEVLRAERDQVREQLDTLDSRLPERTREAQREQKIGSDRAEPIARKQIEAERALLDDRLQRLDAEIRQSERAVTAEADRAALERGEVPERFREEIDAEARRLHEQASPRAPMDRATERTISANLPESLRVAYADLKRSAREQDETLSSLADEAVAEDIRARLDDVPDETDRAVVRQSVDEAETELQEIAARTGDDVSEFIAETSRSVDEARAFGEGFRAYAACRMRNG